MKYRYEDLILLKFEALAQIRNEQVEESQRILLISEILSIQDAQQAEPLSSKVASRVEQWKRRKTALINCKKESDACVYDICINELMECLDK